MVGGIPEAGTALIENIPTPWLLHLQLKQEANDRTQKLHVHVPKMEYLECSLGSCGTSEITSLHANQEI